MANWLSFPRLGYQNTVLKRRTKSDSHMIWKVVIKLQQSKQYDTAIKTDTPVDWTRIEGQEIHAYHMHI